MKIGQAHLSSAVWVFLQTRSFLTSSFWLMKRKACIHVGTCRCDLLHSVAFCSGCSFFATRPSTACPSCLPPATVHHSCQLSILLSFLFLFVDVLQELYFRRNLEGSTDWQWSYDALVWFDTDDLAQVGPDILMPAAWVPGHSHNTVRPL